MREFCIAELIIEQYLIKISVKSWPKGQLFQVRPLWLRVSARVNDEFGHSGPAADLLKQFGLSGENIVLQAKKML